MLPLTYPKMNKIKSAERMLSHCQGEIQEMIRERGMNGTIQLEFDSLDMIGTPGFTGMVYMKVKESGPQYELLQDIANLLVKTVIDEEIMPLESLQDNFKFDKETGRYNVNGLRLALMDRSLCMR